MSMLLGACSGGDGWEDPDDPEIPENPTDSKFLLSGSVVMNGEPVNAAAVLLTPGGGTYLTGADGIFNFNDVAAGTYEIKVYKEGCQPFNKSLTVNKNYQDMALTLTANNGNLHLNKGYIDMGLNEGNNVAAFTITNNGPNELSWQATWGARWITKMEPATGTIPAGGSVAVSFTINRDQLSKNTFDNHTGIVVRSTTPGDGSMGELLVTVFGRYALAINNSNEDYVILGDLYIQKVDISENKIDQESAIRLCNNSIKGGFNDWRLPTLDELATMYENRKAIGGFRNDTYWTSTDWDYDRSCIYVLFFSSGISEIEDKYQQCFARAVRKEVQPVQPWVNIPELHLMVQREDLGKTTYSSAARLCEESRTGGYSDWRLPTIGELQDISWYLKSYPLTFETDYSYWSSTAESQNYHYGFSFYSKYSRDYYDYSSNLYVRAVRTVNE